MSSYPEPATLPPPAPPPRRALPLGVAVLSVLVGLYGFVTFVLGLLLFGKVAVSSYLGIPSTFGLAGYELAAVIMVIGLVILGIGVALWRLRLWALVLGLLFLLYELVTYAYAGKYWTFGFLLALVIFLYLIAVNRHFR
jgi:ABC-type multidrug transport system permease subunit